MTIRAGGDGAEAVVDRLSRPRIADSEAAARPMTMSGSRRPPRSSTRNPPLAHIAHAGGDDGDEVFDLPMAVSRSPWWIEP
jgi:hypothetical protein